MGRIRSIKPEFPHSESVGRLSREARLLFLLLFTVVDDSGRARAASRMLASLLYPYDDDAPGLIDNWLAELEREGMIRIYDVLGARYLDIPNWLKHQRIDHPTKSKLPEFSDDFANPREDSPKPRLSLAPDQDRIGRDKDHIRAVAPATRTSRFDEFWEAYPKRDGANPRQPAKKRFDALVKSGADPQAIIDGAKRSADEARSKGNYGTPYVAQAVTWLNQQRWLDYPAQAPPQLELVGFYAEAASRELEAWDAYRQRTEGKSFPRDARGGWRVPAQWPPDREDAA